MYPTCVLKSINTMSQKTIRAHITIVDLNDGKDGVGIKSITEYYLATSASSGVTTGTSGWTTEVQTITATKKYLWNYEVTAYTDGSSTKSSPVVIGVYGDKGETGTSVKVSSTTITYAAGTNGTTAPSSGWSEKVPAVSAGQYLWSKTIVTYSDGKSTTTYSVSYQGTNGSPGEPGTSVTITGQATKYAVTTTAGQPADSAFTSDKIPALSPGDYLWSRTTVTYSGGVQTKSYAVSRIGTDGTDGQPGSDGKNSYTHFAYANSANGQTGFSTTYFDGALYIGVCSDFNEADPEDYKAYTWARMKGDTGTGYSPNMILHTKDMDGWNWGGSSWNIKQEIVKEADGGSYIKQTVTVTPASADPADNIQSYVWVRNGDTAIYKHMEKYPYELFTPGRKYTLSFEYKSDVPVRVQISVRGTGLGYKQPVELTVFPASAEWTRVSASGTCPGGINNEGYKNCLLVACIGSSQEGSDVAAGDTAYFRNFCLVEGEGTQWIPAASEMVGVDGVSVTAVKNMYKAGTSSTEAPEGTYVADVMQAGFSETNKYLWGYEINTLSDGKTIETTKHLVSVWGQTGNPGTDGTKIIPAELTTAFNATYVQWLTLYNQTVGKVWNVDNASDYRVGDIAVITGNVTDRGNIKASLYASVIIVNTSSGIIGTRSYSLVVGNQGEQGSSGVDAKRNLLMNSGVEQTGTAYLVRSDLFITPSEGYVLPGTHTGSLIEGEKYTAVVCFTPNAAGKSLILHHLVGVAQLATWSVESTAERQIFKKTFTFSYRAGYDPRPTTDGGDGYAYFFMRLYYGSSSDHPGGTLHWIKLVKGDTATDEWTPAPEDSNNFDVQVSPAALSFKTNEDDGSVIYSGNTATLTATHGGQPAKVSLVSGSQVLTGLTGLQNSGSGTEAMKVTLTGISYTTQELKVPNGTGYDTKQMKIPVTSGQAAFKVKLTYGSYTEERTITVPFTVDVKASLVSFGTTANSIVGQVWDTNGVVTRLSKVEQKADSITSTVTANKKDADTKFSQIQQTADEITSTVAASRRAGRNLLTGSYWRAAVLTETRHLRATLTLNREYTLSARASISSSLTNLGMKLFVMVSAVQKGGTWGDSFMLVFDTNVIGEKSVSFTLSNKYGKVYGSYIDVHVYATVENSSAATMAEADLPATGAAWVEWVQLEEGGTATPWSSSDGDDVVRPDIVAGLEEYAVFPSSSQEGYGEEVETALPDGTTGKVRHVVADYDAEATNHRTYVYGTYQKAGIKPDNAYTLSFWAKAGDSNTARISVYPLPYDNYTGYMDNVGLKNGGNAAYQMNLEDKIFPSKEWKRYEVTYTTRATIPPDKLSMFLHALTDANYPHADIYFYGWKVEEGSPATDNSLQSEIKQTAKSIDLSIKDMKSGMEQVGIHLDGKNSKITLKAETTVIEGGEFNANNATFKNIKVEGVLASVVAETGYDRRNYFAGDRNMPTEAMNILVRVDLPNSTGTEQHIFLPCDYDFIGSHVMVFADNVVDNTGRVETAAGLFKKVIIRAGRNYMRHAYITFGSGGAGSTAYRTGQNVYTVDSTEGAGAGIRDIFQPVFKSASFFGRWLLPAGTGGAYQSPNEIQVSNGYIEFVGISAPSTSARLYPFAVALQADAGGTQTDDTNSHLLGYETSKRNSSLYPYFTVEMEEDGETPVTDPLQAKLDALYLDGGADALPAGVDFLGVKSVVYHDKSHVIHTRMVRVFQTPLCRWYPVNVCVPDETDENFLKVSYTNPDENAGIRIVDGNMVAGAFYQS